MTSQSLDLAELGWNRFFASQLSTEDLTSLLPVRVVAVHRDKLHVLGAGLDTLIEPFFATTPGDKATAATAGDWLLVCRETLRPLRLLNRASVFKRRAAGTGSQVQLIGANVDTLFVVTSCNQDFNVPRLERYLSLASDAGVVPVVVLTKSDLAADATEFAQKAAALMPGLLVETIDARDRASVARLLPWCAPGQTVALLGSSGVGKSTLINTLSGAGDIATQGVRVHDDKGRHTTTARRLHRLPSGGWMLDSPGMRELQLADVKDGIEEVFDDLVALAETCRFSDCGHATEPGCAVQAAIKSGTLEAARLARWQKLSAEEERNAESMGVRRERARSFGKHVKSVMKEKRSRFTDRS